MFNEKKFKLFVEKFWYKIPEYRNYSNSKEIIENLKNDLFNLDKITIFGYDEYDTYILREYFGIIGEDKEISELTFYSKKKNKPIDNKSNNQVIFNEVNKIGLRRRYNKDVTTTFVKQKRLTNP